MTPEEFVAVVRLVAVDQAADGTVKVLRKPPGKSPWPVGIRRSEWFNALVETDQQMVAEVVISSAFQSAFNFCNILDGTTAFDSAGGSLKLLYVAADGTETVLNDPARCELHAELRGDGPPV